MFEVTGTVNISDRLLRRSNSFAPVGLTTSHVGHASVAGE
jgi:hypothetical protein